MNDHRNGRRGADEQATAPVSLLVVDPYPIVRDGIAHLADSIPWITLAGYARTGSTAITLAERTQPDIILLDLRLPDLLGSEVINGIRRRAPEAKIILFTDHATVRPALAAGAQAILSKDTDRANLVETIRSVAIGHTFDHRQNPVDTNGFSLTEREYDILRHISIGETNPEIAEALGLKPNTVKTYVQNALSKLGARNRIEALNRLTEHSLL